MNNKAQTMGLILISSIFFFICGMMMINFLMPEVDRTRVDLNCASADTITSGNKMLCLVIDVTIIYWIILVFSIVLGALTSRMFM